MSRLVVELAGPAGAGKTTLARTLRDTDPAATTVGVHVGARECATALLSAAPHLLAARMSTRGRWWTRDELRSLAYLLAWRQVVRERASGPEEQGPGARSPGLLLLDHGPVFRLARLAAFGPPMADTAPFATWWTGLAREWGRLLDVVVWLDAPDAVLVRRIAERTRRHRIRGADEEEGARFLARYRAAYRTTLDVVTSAGARVVAFDTAADPPDRLAAGVQAAVLRQSPASGPSPQHPG